MNASIFESHVRPLNALLIEDSDDDIFLIRKLIAESGVDVNLQVIRDGEMALEFLLRQRQLPQVVLLDLSLPGVSGIEILRRIKAESLLVDIPVIVISGTEREDEIRFRDALIHTHITKPISRDEFTWIVRSMESYWRRIERMESEWGPAWLSGPA